MTGEVDVAEFFHAHDLLTAPVRLEPLPSYASRDLYRQISGCTECALSKAGNPYLPGPLTNSGLTILTPDPGLQSDLNQTIIRWIHAGLNRDMVYSLVGLTQCKSADGVGSVAQQAKCAPNVSDSLRASTPRWIFLVGQSSIDYWQTCVGAPRGEFYDATHVELRVRKGSKKKRKVSQLEVDMLREDNSISMDWAAGRVGIWPEMGAYVMPLPVPDGERWTMRRVVNRVSLLSKWITGEKGNVLEWLSVHCVKCPGFVWKYSDDGIAWCKEHYCG